MEKAILIGFLNKETRFKRDRGINEKKQSQQIIVVTHNPNIVVNTNSEQVINMEFAGGEINASH